MSITLSTLNSCCNQPVPCPLCRSTASFHLRAHAAQPIIARWKQLYDADVGRYFAGLDFVQEFRCPDCGIQFFHPGTLAGGPELYEALAGDAHAGPQYYRPSKWEFDVALEDISAICGNDRPHLLEIGCGAGDFLLLVQKRLAAMEVEGIDENQAAIREGRRRGLLVHQEDISDFSRKTSRQYAGVCLFQILEHVPDTGQVLRSVCGMLKPGGRLILAVPNAEGFLRHAWNILDMPPHHMTRWPKSAIAQLPEMLPLRLVRVLDEPLADYHVTDYAEAYLSFWSQKPGLRALAHPAAKSLAASLIRYSGLRHFLKGHTTYACFERT